MTPPMQWQTPTSWTWAAGPTPRLTFGGDWETVSGTWSAVDYTYDAISSIANRLHVYRPQAGTRGSGWLSEIAS